MKKMNKKIMNQIVKIAASRQNENLKLNAGLWREAASIIFEILCDFEIQHNLNLKALTNGKETVMKKTSAKKATKKVTPKKK